MEIVMLDPNHSLTRNALFELSEHQKNNFGPQGVTFGFRIGSAIVPSLASSLDTLHHLIACVIKIATGIIATPYELVTESGNLKNWTWMAANEHFSQTLKHFLLTFSLPFVTFIYLPATSLRTFFNDNQKVNVNGNNQSQLISNLAKQVATQQKTINDLGQKLFNANEKLKTDVKQEKDKAEAASRTDQDKIKTLQGKLQIAESKNGLHETAIKQKDATINQLRNVNHIAPQPQVFNQKLSEKEAEIKRKDADIKSKDFQINQQTQRINILVAEKKELNAKKDADIKNKDFLINQQTQRINKLVAETKELNAKLETAQNKIKPLQDRVKKLEDDMLQDEDKAVVASLRAENERLVNENKNINQQLEDIGSGVEDVKVPAPAPAVAKVEDNKFPKELVTALNSIAKELVCAYSLEVMEKAITAVPCGHNFDKAVYEESLMFTVNKIVNCPTCNIELIDPKTKDVLKPKANEDLSSFTFLPCKHEIKRLKLEQDIIKPKCVLCQTSIEKTTTNNSNIDSIVQEIRKINELLKEKDQGIKVLA